MNDSSMLCSALSNVLGTAAAKSLQSCPTLCDPIDGSPPGSSIPGILQARTLEWVLGTEPYISIQITPPCLQGISQSSTHLWGKRVCNKVKFLLSFQFQDLTLAPLAALQFFWNDSAQFSLQWCVSSISHQLFFLICNLVVNTYLYARKINKT